MRKEAGFENRDRFVELGLMISALRKAKGYTQHELAEKAHISRSHLSSIEAPNITSSFSLEVFFNIADILEVKPGDLLNLNFGLLSILMKINKMINKNINGVVKCI